MPVSDAQFYALLSRAYPGGITRREMRWEVSLVEAWSMILASGLLHGESYIWPDPRLSSSGREMLRIQSLRESYQRGEWKPVLDL